MKDSPAPMDNDGFPPIQKGLIKWLPWWLKSPWPGKVASIRIMEAVSTAELLTSAEIRVHIEPFCQQSPLDRASYLFAKLKMHKTRERNGVLIYMAYESHKFAILGDKGINAQVEAGFWDECGMSLSSNIRDNKPIAGLVEVVQKCGRQLQAFFPYTLSDKNELSNKISRRG